MMRRGGFTLVELVVALGISATLLVGMASAVMVASRALPERGGPVVAEANLSRTLDALEAELGSARTIVSIAEHGLSFTVSDRDADALPEQITWSWSGTAGDPLLRELNDEGGRQASVGLQAVQIRALVRNVTEPGWDAGAPSTERTVAEGEFETLGGLTNWFDVSGNAEYMQEVTPDFDADVETWDPKWVRIYARAPTADPGYGMYIEVVTLTDTGQLEGRVLGRSYILARDLSGSGGWVGVPTTGQVRVEPDQRLAVRVTSSNPADGQSVGTIQASVVALTGESMKGRFDSGSTFTDYGTNQMRFGVAATTWSPGSDASTVTAKAGSLVITITDTAGYSATRSIPFLWPVEVAG